MTEDDIHLLPIAGVKVFLIGLENRAVFTDAAGEAAAHGTEAAAHGTSGGRLMGEK